MPLVIDRRSFLKRTGAGALFSIASHWSFADTSATTRVALLSDTHIAANAFDTFRGFYPHRNLHKTVDQVAAMPFDMLLVNGDLARQTGELLDYLQFNSFIHPFTKKMPVTVTLGNHDHRPNAYSALVDHAGEQQPVSRKLVSTIDSGPLHFVLLDSLLTTNIAAGELGVVQSDWLSRYLDGKTDKPIVVFVHHNPAPDALQDTERLLKP